ncbi:hypothetical protein KPATCC21470_3891 [Kitasatospora purpeofusca]
MTGRGCAGRRSGRTWMCRTPKRPDADAQDAEATGRGCDGGRSTGGAN